MKKIPTLFEREFDDKHNFTLLNKVREGFEWVLEGEGIPTVKFDGQCTAIINGVFYKRYDNKKGKKLPDGAIKCCEPDAITGHSPYWVVVDPIANEDVWLYSAYLHYGEENDEIVDGTYEAIGKHFQGNPYNLDYDILVKHGESIITDLYDRSYTGIYEYLKTHDIEGIVFWKDGEPQCKIRKTDYGLKWR